MKKILVELFAGKNLFLMTLGVVGFFCLIILSWYFHHLGSAVIFTRLVGVLGNILMLPMVFLFYPVLLIFSIIHCIHEKFKIKSWSLVALILLLVSNPYFVGSIINNYCK